MSKKKLNIVSIRSNQNQFIKELTSLRLNVKTRQSLQKVAIFDTKAIFDLKKLSIESVFGTDIALLSKCKAKNKFLVSVELFKKVSGLNTNQGLAAIYLMPKMTSKWPDKLLVLDGVADPGNVGTLIRSALAFQFEGVIFLEHCADPYNDKALRAAKGLTLNCWIKKIDTQQFISQWKESKHALYIADSKGKQKVTKKQKLALVLGNEGSGVSASIEKLGTSVSIAMNDQVESLNVAIAGSILMHEISYG